MSAERYAAQVALLVRCLPEIAVEEAFALKGGTAINLFIHDLPRFSVDIDLVYLPVAERTASLDAIQTGFARIADRLRRRIGAGVQENQSAEGTRMVVRAGAAQIKVELSPVLRGTVFEPEVRAVSPAVEERFGYAEMQVVSLPDLYGGKITAALDRQHPRDLFDVRYLYDNGGITQDIFTTFLVYLISHPRPAYELLQPGLKDLTNEYQGDFEEMTVDAVPLESLLETRETLIDEIARRARLPASRSFLQSFFACEPDWSLLDLAADISALPAVQWKLRNLERLRAEQPAKFERELARLDEALR
ncbi:MULTISPECIES: nucleotidyl transferase AbiEii/AbiGii toxin family protein [Sphingobium]|jgi:predicted nucleotidyltransferase component of viral defense system|uniref:nucleotidyl transferase AbiEii/AbiGii toxin family protein n=1 Tax=Sphingobium TaxID=165695 RepID=UPI000C6A30A2|nr:MULTISPECIES: nucleotidyl transferase AbiEii/AbiGii toxin family protein [Sphingobium]MAX15782.1 hypothetical protein [Sphingobium sp.]MBS50813.1 hypothetical protein [Sphingobium sp.]MCC4257647.1 nucleotidyl transferase AbiEii/AbiGii toxin family protein [Sphingobium lactosutens]HCW61042.1 hypothetical protein [Sphingobium sp.]|tara:strand:+ start:2981 stop:3895 length:915 start_codon:yes stop_codon:yes gene_type:complete